MGQNPSLRRRLGLPAGAVLAVGLLLLPPPAGLTPAAWHTAALGLLMAVWWMTEALPIPATALLPLALFPLFGVASMEKAAAPFAHPLIFLFLGGFLLALAMERWRLHRRIALAVVMRLGTRPVRLVAGFMVASALLSMWISNTATAMLMLPIGLSLVDLVRRSTRGGGTAGGAAVDDDDSAESEPEGPAGDPDAPGTRFALCLMLGIAYGASLGGIGTLIGTPTNALLAAFLSDGYGFEIAFVDWMAVGVPIVVIGLPIMLWVLTRLVYPIRLREVPGGRAFIRSELDRLGKASPAEKRVAVLFALTAAAWIGRPLLARWLPGLTDPGIAMTAALALFVVPAGTRLPRDGHAAPAQGETGSAGPLLDWRTARRLPWGVLLLFGGGLSLAAAIRDTGLADRIGEAMHGLAALPAPLIVGVVMAVILLLTELTSNTATAAAFLPVLASMAHGLGLDPLSLLVPATLAASCAFMLPVATPPNAIVYGSGMVSVPQMVRAGVWLNLLFLGIIGVVAWLLVPLVLGHLPAS
jgi:sodium-dependent dicarboxylate transporter 2/3/5